MRMTSSFWNRIGSVTWAILLVFTLVTPIPAMAQESSADDVEVSAVEVPPPDMQSEILTRLDSAVAATTRGVEAGAEFTWPILVRQQMIQGGLSLLTVILAIMVTGFAIHHSQERSKLTKSAPKAKRSYHEAWVFVSSVVASIVGVFGGMWFLVEGATKLFNPEYHALADILKMLGISG